MDLSFGAKLKFYLDYGDITKKELSTRLGITTRVLNNWLSCRVVPDQFKQMSALDMALRLSRYPRNDVLREVNNVTRLLESKRKEVIEEAKIVITNPSLGNNPRDEFVDLVLQIAEDCGLRTPTIAFDK